MYLSRKECFHWGIEKSGLPDHTGKAQVCGACLVGEAPPTVPSGNSGEAPPRLLQVSVLSEHDYRNQGTVTLLCSLCRSEHRAHCSPALPGTRDPGSVSQCSASQAEGHEMQRWPGCHDAWVVPTPALSSASSRPQNTSLCSRWFWSLPAEGQQVWRDGIS